MQTNSERLQALSNIYTFLGDLFLSAPDVQLLPYIQSIPELESALEEMCGDQDTPETYLQHKLPADHYHVFGLNVYPYESTFLESEIILDGEVTNRVRGFYSETGIYMDTRNVSADHIGIELNFLSALCKGEAHIIGDDGDSHTKNSVMFLQYRFLTDHVLRWLPALVRALQHQNNPFYAALAQLTLDIVIDHFIILSEAAFPLAKSFALPSSPLDMADSKTSLKDIAQYLLTPVFSGFYLSKEDIKKLARDKKLPIGFGNRQQMLTNLLRNASDYDLIDDLLSDIKIIAESWKTFYSTLVDDATSKELITSFTTPWMSQIINTENLLRQIQTEIPSND